MTDSSFSEFGLADPIQRALTARKHLIPTPIQRRAIPELLAGKDVLGIAQTGTGKTAAFALPILHQLSQGPAIRGPRGARAVILAPTRELAIQIAEEFRIYGKELQLRQALIYGGVSQKPQVDALSRGTDIIIATPGRLLDLMNQRRARLDSVEFLVLDEADRMLDMGFVRDVRKIIAAMPATRQSLLFSATMPNNVARLSGEILSDPVRVEVTPQSTPLATVEQNIYHVAAARKTALLTRILADPALARVIVFARTKHRANRVAEQLEKCGVVTEAIHGNKSQAARQRALTRFRSGQVRVLVATDIAARGIDVDGVTHVINYEIPNEPESYVHRIGRTARAGAKGVALSFCDTAERGYMRDIERLIKLRLTVVGAEAETLASEGPDNRSRDEPRNRRGPSHNGPARNGPGRNGPARNGPAREGQARNGPARNGPAREGQARDGQARTGEARNGPARNGPAREGQARNGQARTSEVRIGPVRNSPAREGQTRNGEVRNGPSRDGQARNGQARNGEARNGQARNGQARDGQARNVSARNGEAREGQFRKGPARDGQPPRKGGNGKRPAAGPARGASGKPRSSAGGKPSRGGPVAAGSPRA